MPNKIKFTREYLDRICCEIDRLFSLYGKPNDNCIVLGVYYKWSRKVVCEEPVALSIAGDFRYFSDCYDWDYSHNPYVRPIMHDISAFTVICRDKPNEANGKFGLRKGKTIKAIDECTIQEKDIDKIPDMKQIEQLRDYYDDAETLFELIRPYMHEKCGDPRRFCDSSTNCYWRNFLVVGRDYKFRTFTMRFDAMMCNEHEQFDEMVVDQSLANIGHVRQKYARVKDYGPNTNVPVRKPVAFIDWPDFKKHITGTLQVDDPENLPFSHMKLKELPISLIMDMFLHEYDHGSEPVLKNWLHYHPLNTDEKIYKLCQNSVYRYNYEGSKQIGFNWFKLCCIHGDTNSRNHASKRIVETYVGDMTPDEFIEFIRTKFCGGHMEYTGDKSLLYYGLRVRKNLPWHKVDEFGPDQCGTQYGFTSGCYSRWKPWFLSTEQYDYIREHMDEFTTRKDRLIMRGI